MGDYSYVLGTNQITNKQNMAGNKSFSVTSGTFNCTEVTLCSKDDTEFFEFVEQRGEMAPAVFSKVNFSLSLSSVPFNSDQEQVDFIQGFGRKLDLLGHRLVGVIDTKIEVAKAAGVQFLARPKSVDDDQPSMSSGLVAKVNVSEETSSHNQSDVDREPDVIEKIVEVEKIVHVEKVVEVERVVEVPATLESVDNTMIVKGPIRGGQQIYAEGQNLLILGDVKRGASVSADGSITVFGRLNGSANAGHKSKQSTIIATDFDPELVSVDGVFYTQEQLDFKEKNGTVIVYLDVKSDKLILHAGGKL